jgi:hypothetical protein
MLASKLVKDAASLVAGLMLLLLAAACFHWRRPLGTANFNLLPKCGQRFWTQERTVDFYAFVSFLLVLFAVVGLAAAF